MSKWKMRFNPGKCKFMVFGNRASLERKIRLTIKTCENDVHELEESAEEIDLGVCLKNNQVERKCQDRLQQCIQLAWIVETIV
jgi:hypothetical protein